MAKSKYVLTEKQIIKRINEGRGAGRLSDYKPWLYVNEVPSEGRSQRVYYHLTGRVHHVLSDLEFAVFLLLDHNPAVTDIREQFPLNRDDTLNISKEGQLWHPSQGGVMKVEIRAATAGYLLRLWNVDCSKAAQLKTPEFHL